MNQRDHLSHSSGRGVRRSPQAKTHTPVRWNERRENDRVRECVGIAACRFVHFGVVECPLGYIRPKHRARGTAGNTSDARAARDAVCPRRGDHTEARRRSIHQCPSHFDRGDPPRRGALPVEPHSDLPPLGILVVRDPVVLRRVARGRSVSRRSSYRGRRAGPCDERILDQCPPAPGRHGCRVSVTSRRRRRRVLRRGRDGRGVGVSHIARRAIGGRNHCQDTYRSKASQHGRSPLQSPRGVNKRVSREPRGRAHAGRLGAVASRLIAAEQQRLRPQAPKAFVG